MYMQDVLTQEFQVLIPKRQRASVSVDPPEWAHRSERYEHQDRSLPKAVLFHDSFGLPLIPLLSAHFSELTSLWQHDFNVSVIEALEPDVVLVKPCGFDVPRTLEEVGLLRTVLASLGGTALSNGRVWVADGNAYFNRPGPRVVDSLELLAACVHPDEFGDLAERHRAFYRVL